MGITTLQSRGQVTIPAQIRREFGWNPGDSVVFTARNDGVVELRVIRRRSVNELLEKYSHEGVAPALEELRQVGADDQFSSKFSAGEDR